MALAQQTDILLLDEPTTYLDVAYQLDILDTLGQINRERGVTIANADHMYALAGGSIVAEGTPCEVVTPSVLAKVFGLECVVIDDPVSHTPLMVPTIRVTATVA